MTGIAYPIAQDNETHRARVWRTSKRARFSNICLLGVCQCRHGNGLIMGLYAHRNQRFAPIQAEIIAVFLFVPALLFCVPFAPVVTPTNRENLTFHAQPLAILPFRATKLTLSGHTGDHPRASPLSRSQLKCEGMVARQFLFVLCKNEAAASEKAYSQSFSG